MRWPPYSFGFAASSTQILRFTQPPHLRRSFHLPTTELQTEKLCEHCQTRQQRLGCCPCIVSNIRSNSRFSILDERAGRWMTTKFLTVDETVQLVAVSITLSVPLRYGL
jgi:hypothetical protein